MATKIIFKKSSSGGTTPDTTDLQQAEFAVNLADRKLFTKDNSNNIVRVDGAYVSETEPSNGAEGDLWYDTGNNLLKAHNGTSFVSVGELTRVGFVEGALIDLTGDTDITTSGDVTIAVDLEELTDMTPDATASDEFVMLDNSESAGSKQKRKQAGEIGVSVFNNDANYSTTVGTVTSVGITPGSLIDVSGTPVTGSGNITVNVDLSELTDMTDTMEESDEFVVLDTSQNDPQQQRRKAASEIPLSIFNNDDGFLTAESDTLATVTTRGNTTTNSVTVGGLTVNGDATIDSDLTVTGNLTVSGTTTTVNSNEVNIGDSVILLNADLDTDTAPSENGGISVNRGSAADKSFIWNETADAWDLSNETLQNVTLDGGTY